MLFSRNDANSGLSRAAWKKSLPYILTVELLLAAILIPLLFVHLAGSGMIGTGEAEVDTAGVRPESPPTVDWPEPRVYLQQNARPTRFTDLPYEVSDGRGAVLLPDVFYADEFQNQQIMRTELDLPLATAPRPHPYRVDRLIYPTIGNPALVVRSDRDALRVVLRLKTPDFAILDPRLADAKVAHAPHLRSVTFAKQDDRNRVIFYLLNREQRNITEGGRPAPVNVAGAIEIEPAAVYMHDRETVPRPLRGRDTFQFVFTTEALKKFEPGLYDLRLEIFQKGRMLRHEFQYNAVRVFDAVPERYSILGISDSQVSPATPALDHLKRFIAHAKAGQDVLIQEAAFIVHKGDLHRGGTRDTLMPEAVARAYNDEATRIIESLRELPVPIFLAPGDHDGGASMGHVPPPIRSRVSGLAFLGGLFGAEKSLGTVVRENAGGEGWREFSAYRQRSSGRPGGWPRDIFAGRFVRRGRTDAGSAFTWQLLPDNGRNQVLYDGFYQWRHAYGPLFYSFRFGRNHFVVLNSYDLRQHRRSGWGGNTVNTGGGLSPFQMNWLRRDLSANEAAGREITLIAHHDPRGGRGGKDQPYYFKMLPYTGMDPDAEGNAPPVHDGPLEWMRADPDFDCADEDIFEEGPRAGYCDDNARESRRPRASGFRLLQRIARQSSIRTLLLGHAARNTMEILQPGDEIVPGRVELDLAPDGKTARIEMAGLSRERAHARRADDEDGRATDLDIVEEDGVSLGVFDLAKSGQEFPRRLARKELAILRTTSLAPLSRQRYRDEPLNGFSVFEVFVRRGYPRPQINRVHYYQRSDEPGGAFQKVHDIALERTRRWTRSSENPLLKIFKLPETDLPGAEEKE